MLCGSTRSTGAHLAPAVPLVVSHPPTCSPCCTQVSPGRMRRKIHNPRILLMDCPLEYKKGENQTNVEITKEEDWWV